MLIEEIEIDHPAVAEIMEEFNILWPKIVFFDPNLEGYQELIRSVYAQGMVATLEALAITDEQTIH